MAVLGEEGANRASAPGRLNFIGYQILDEYPVFWFT